MIPNITEFTPEQFREWIQFLVNESLFESRERLVALLTNNADRAALEAELRDFFEEYCGLAFELEDHEAALLSMLESCDTFVPLRHRVAAVEAQRKTSPLGRESRRTGAYIIGDHIPETKVADLSADEFRAFMNTLANWQLFAARERVVKLLSAKTDENDRDPSAHDGISTATSDMPLKSAFLEFFVCYLELEQFFEDYDYDSDEGLEIRPEFAEELKREDEYIKSGGKMFTLEEVAKEFGVKLKNV